MCFCSHTFNPSNRDALKHWSRSFLDVIQDVLLAFTHSCWKKELIWPVGLTVLHEVQNVVTASVRCTREMISPKD